MVECCETGRCEGALLIRVAQSSSRTCFCFHIHLTAVLSATGHDITRRGHGPPLTPRRKKRKGGEMKTRKERLGKWCSVGHLAWLRDQCRFDSLVKEREHERLQPRHLASKSPCQLHWDAGITQDGHKANTYSTNTHTHSSMVSSLNSSVLLQLTG